MVKKIMPGDVIKVVPCDGCGAPSKVKMNKKGCVYTKCWAVTSPELSGHDIYCRSGFLLGQKPSRELIEEVEKQPKGLEDGKLEQIRDRENRENGTPEPEPRPEPARAEPERKGILDSLFD